MADKIRELIGKRVKQIRMDRGLSQAELAKKMNWQQPDISDLEHGRHNPKSDTLDKLAKALKVSISELVSQA